MACLPEFNPKERGSQERSDLLIMGQEGENICCMNQKKYVQFLNRCAIQKPTWANILIISKKISNLGQFPLMAATEYTVLQIPPVSFRRAVTHRTLMASFLVVLLSHTHLYRYR